MNNKKLRLIYFTLNNFLTSISSLSALQVLPFIDQQSSEIYISKKDFTRIKIREDRIKQLFGQTDKFIIEIDEELGQIFIKPLSTQKGPIRLTIITENGLTHDLKISAKDQEIESILFTPSTGLKGQTSELNSASIHSNYMNDQEQIISILKDFSKQTALINFKNQYHDNFITFPDLNDLKIQLMSQKQYNAYIIIAYEITNTSAQTITLNPYQFYQQTIPAIDAIAFKTQILAPDAATTLYIIKRDNHESAQPLN